MNKMEEFITYYSVIVNILSFVLMGVDKKKAVNYRWRISEKVLFSPAALGGALGSLLGMFVFNHKKHKKLFKVGVPVSTAIQIIAVVVALYLCNRK